MKFSRYVQERWKTLALLLAAVITIEIFLLVYDIHIIIRIYVAGSILIGYVLGTYAEYRSKKSFYDDMMGKLNGLNEKYLVVEMLQTADYTEEKLLNEVLQETSKSMLENVNAYKYAGQEYKDYIELWIHEIKLPIATSKMIIENNKNDVTRRIDGELDEIEGYIEQALFYARSNHVNKDYCITKCMIKDIVNPAIKKNKQTLISQRIRIEIQNGELEIYTDAKWCIFILNQIIQNSVKYRREAAPVIEFIAEEKKDCVVLTIRDNGIGIRESEVTRVFEKGFTGTNGRIGKKSTGIGLYLCKKLCDKLGLGLELSSKETVGTEVRLVFPKNSYIEM